MKKLILFLALTLSLTGCGLFDSSSSPDTKKAKLLTVGDIAMQEYINSGGGGLILTEATGTNLATVTPFIEGTFGVLMVDRNPPPYSRLAGMGASPVDISAP